MKKIVVKKEKCVACGICTIDSDVLMEDSEGFVEVIEPGIISDDKLDNMEKIVSLCPVKALSLASENIDMQEKLRKLKIEMKEPLKLSPPAKSEYSWELEEKNQYVEELPQPYISGEDDYCYKSRSDARSAGKAAFRDEVHSQADALAQQLVITYWQRKLNAVVRYAEVEGNFKYETHKALVNKLKSYVCEIEVCCGRKLSLPDDFYEFCTKDTEYIEDMQDGPNEWLAERIHNNLPDASEFYNSIRTDGDETVVKVSHLFGDDTYEFKKRYAYNIQKCIYYFNRAIGRLAWRCGKYTLQDGEREFNRFCREITEEWDGKIDLLYKQAFDMAANSKAFTAKSSYTMAEKIISIVTRDE